VCRDRDHHPDSPTFQSRLALPRSQVGGIVVVDNHQTRRPPRDAPVAEKHVVAQEPALIMNNDNCGVAEAQSRSALPGE